MTDSGTKEALRIGFLAAISDEERGYVGGLLVTNRFGRPLEFQCTAPVKANRTQEILYGPTLPGYVMGDVIGRTLVEKANTRPQLVLVDCEALLEMRPSVNTPTAVVEHCAQRTAETSPPPEATASELVWVRWKFQTHVDFADDVAALRGLTPQLPESADLLEPFERVREALAETLQAGVLKAAG